MGDTDEGEVAMNARHEPEILYSLEDARRFIMLARRAHPGLGLYGFLEGCANQKDPLTADDETAYQVAVAATWIASRGRRKDMACSSSYGLKHVVESWTAKNGGKVYIPNGTFIAAAIGLGFKARQDWHGSPNARFSITNDTIKKESCKMTTKHKSSAEEFLPGGHTSKSERYGWKILDEPGEFMWIDKKDILVDHTYQREEKVHTVFDIRKGWTWRGFGVVSVALRNDGKFYAFDGQNRVAASQAIAEIQKLPCMVFTSENVADEADAFLKANTNRKLPSAADKHRAMLVNGDPIAIETERLAKLAGRKIGKASDATHIRCVGVLHKLVREKKEPLLRVWSVLAEVCAGNPMHERLIEALVEIERRLPSGVSLSERKVRQRIISIGYQELVNAAARATAFYSRGGAAVWARGIVEVYNKGLRVNKLVVPGLEP